MKFGVGIQEFSKLRELGCVYVDKTEHIYNLIQNGNHYFLSRPRRFGKSLLINTLKEIFLGNKDLFKGLWIENKIEWKKHPVIRISFASISYHHIGLDKALEKEMLVIANQYQIILENQTDCREMFKELILKLSEKEQVVILIDEYDKPIIDYLSKEEIKIAQTNRNVMKRFYGILKDLDKHIRFFFLTGVSKFSRVSIFSDLNHLEDLTLNYNSGTLLGYTQTELEFYFKEDFEALAKREQLSYDDLMQEVKVWYNGYNFLGNEKVYNPFSILRLLKSQQFDNYWFETGTPTFLIDLLKEKRLFEVENSPANEMTLSNFSLDKLEVLTILYQTGYLTITEKKEMYYKLSYPNREVRRSFQLFLLAGFSGEDNFQKPLEQLQEAMFKPDFKKMERWFNALLKNIPYNVFQPEDEAFYHAVFFLTFKLLGYQIECEVQTNDGRIDAIAFVNGKYFLFEFKVGEKAESALNQIDEKEYYLKYELENKPIYVIGIACWNKKIADIMIEQKG